MKILTIFALMISISTYAETTVKKESLKNGDSKVTISQKDHGSTTQSTSTVSKKDADSSAPFYKAIADCKPLKSVQSEAPMTVEYEVLGLIVGKCKVTTKLYVNGKPASLTTCLLTAENRKNMDTNGLELLAKVMADEKICQTTGL